LLLTRPHAVGFEPTGDLSGCQGFSGPRRRHWERLGCAGRARRARRLLERAAEEDCWTITISAMGLRSVGRPLVWFLHRPLPPLSLNYVGTPGGQPMPPLPLR
jgi:hypothetical protein